MIAIIDYDMGNIASILNMFKRIGERNVVLTKDPEVIKSATKLILPGVGAFDAGMSNLRESGLVEVLTEQVVVKKKPVLGICLGMQLLANSSEEGLEKGLGWVDADVRKFKFENTDLKIPHMGWNYIQLVKKSNLLQGDLKRKFYFVHSYYFHCNNSNDVLATTSYGIDFSCMIQHDNVYGAQFHPEKSHKFGMELFENFAKL